MDEPPQINPLNYGEIIGEVFSWVGYDVVKEVSTVSKIFESVGARETIILDKMANELTAKTPEGNMEISIKLCRPEYVKRLMAMNSDLVPSYTMVSYIFKRCIVGHPQSSCYMKIYRELNLGQLLYIQNHRKSFVYRYVDLGANYLSLREVFESLGGTLFSNIISINCGIALENILANLDIFFDQPFPNWNGPVQYDIHGRRQKSDFPNFKIDNY